MGLDEWSNWGEISQKGSRFFGHLITLCCFVTYKITKNFAGILACRVFIGLPEAAFYPGAIFLLSRWYTRKVTAYTPPVFTLLTSAILRNWPSVLLFYTRVCSFRTHLEV